MAYTTGSPFPSSTHLPLTLLQAASKTNDTAGDGTTTATILSAAIIAEGMKIVAAGTNPVQLTRGIEKTVTALVKELQGLSTDVSDADLANVATVSAGGDETVRTSSCCQGMFLVQACPLELAASGLHEGVLSIQRCWAGLSAGLMTWSGLLAAHALGLEEQVMTEQLGGQQKCWVVCVLFC